MNADLMHVKIVEQPSSRGTRFRYDSEGRSTDNITGASGTKSFPSIRVINYSGPLTVIVSCVTKDPPYWPHPYKLINGYDSHEHGVCYFYFPNNTHDICFKNLSIKRVTKQNIAKSLAEREQMEVDPFKTGFTHTLKSENIDFNCVRLCFHVRLETPLQGFIFLDPVVSDPIFDKKSATDLKICWLSHCSATVAGGTEMCILCEKVYKTDIEVRFYHKESNWEAAGTLITPKVFRQVAIVFKTPEYRTAKCSPEQIREPIDVEIKLKRLSNGETSEPRYFQLLPLGPDDPTCIDNRNSLKRKRERYSKGLSGSICETLQTQIMSKPDLISINHPEQSSDFTPKLWQVPQIESFAKTTEPWQCTSWHETTAPQPQWSKLPQLNNCMNILSEKPTVDVASNNSTYHYNIQPTAMDLSKQNQNYNSADALGSDSLLNDLLERLDESDPTTSNKIAHEPETHFITPKLASSCRYDNVVNTDNPNQFDTKQVDEFLNSDFTLGSSCSNVLNNVRSSDLMRITNENEYLDQNFVNVNPPNQDNKFKTDNIQDLICIVNALYKSSGSNVNVQNVRNISEMSDYWHRR